MRMRVNTRICAVRWSTCSASRVIYIPIKISLYSSCTHRRGRHSRLPIETVPYLHMQKDKKTSLVHHLIIYIYVQKILAKAQSLTHSTCQGGDCVFLKFIWKLRSIFYGRLMGQIRHILVWRSTSVGRWRGKPRWILRSRRSISSLVVQ